MVIKKYRDWIYFIFENLKIWNLKEKLCKVEQLVEWWYLDKPVPILNTFDETQNSASTTDLERFFFI